MQIDGPNNLTSCKSRNQGADDGRQGPEEVPNDVREPRVVRPATIDQQPVQVIFHQTGQRDAMGAIGRGDACVNATAGDLVDVFRDHLGIGDGLITREQVRHLAFGRLARILLHVDLKRDLQRGEQHLDLQTERADILQTERGAEGNERQRRDGGWAGHGAHPPPRVP